MRTRALSAIVLAAALALPSGCIVRAQPRPNVLLISIDTLNRSALRAFDPGAPALPHLDALTRRARAFDEAISPASWTLPAHASLLTGLYPDRHGATHGSVRIAEAVDPLAARLSRAGYETVGYTDGGFVSGIYGFAEGFDRYEGLEGRPDVRDDPSTEARDADLFARARAFLAERGRRAAEQRPFFLFVQTYSVHNYFKVRSWARQPGREGAYRESGEYLACLLGREACSPEDWEVMRELYAAELHHMDAGVGRLLATLEEQGLADSTLVVLLSDHGEGFEPGLARIHHGGRLHADVLRVPLLVAGPGVEPGRSRHPVSLVDVAPTLLDWIGEPAEDGLDGISFAGALRGEAAPEARPLYGMEYAFTWQEGPRLEMSGPIPKPLALAVVGGDGWYIGSAAGQELYALESDAGQTRNLAADPMRLEPHRQASRARAGLTPPAERLGDDPELVEQLRALGYLDAPVPAAPADGYGNPPKFRSRPGAPAR